MPIVALILLVGWIVVVSVAGAAVQLRRTGRIELRVRDQPGSPQWWSRRISTIGVAVGIAAPFADLAGVPSIAFLETTAVQVVGIALVAAGIALSIGSQIALGESWRADVDPAARTKLVTTGPFRYVRNPILSGAAISSIGLALVVPNVFSIGMVVAVLAAHQIQVRLVEEPYLLEVHGDAYRRYAARTGRFVPGIGRLHA